MRNLLTLAVAVATAAPVAAHHSDAGLDMQSLVTLDGTVVEYNWRSPHVYIVAPMTHSRELFYVPDHEPTRFDCDIESTRRFVPE